MQQVLSGVGKRPWLPLVVILILTSVVYRGVLNNQFVLDDTHVVAHNPAVRSLAHVGEWLTSPYAASGMRDYPNYRPVLVASYAIDYALWGAAPVGFHATNLAIHLGVVLLAFVLGRRLSPDPLMAVCAAGLVALHPINAETVNYVAARSSSLSALLVLGAIWASARADERGTRGWRVGAYLLGLSALGTKEIAVVLPVLIIVWRRAAHGSREPWTASLRSSVPWWLLVIGFWAFRMWILWGLVGTAISGPGVTLWYNTLFALKIYSVSLAEWWWPTALSVDHAWPWWISWREAVVIAAVLIVALAGTVLLARRNPRWGWCAVWFWVAIAPAGALGFVSRLTLYQDNRVYLAGVGFAWLVGHVAAAALRRLSARPVGRIAATAAVIVLIAAAARVDAARTSVWTDRASLWDDVLTKYPRSLMAHNGKGMVAFDAGRYEEARDWFERTVRISPGYAEGHRNLGVTFTRLGDWERSIAALEYALSIQPDYVEARVTLGKVYERLNRPDRALEAYDQALQHDPGHVVLLARTAWLLAQMGRPIEAAERYRRVVSTGRAEPETVLDYGVLLMRLERWDEAEQVFSSLAARDPNSYVARFNLGTALEGRGEWERAAEEYRRAAALNAADPDPIFRVGVLFSKQQRWEDAIAAYDQALARNPSHVPTHMNLGLLAERRGDLPQAIAHYEAALRAPASRAGDEMLQARARHAVTALREGSRKPGG